LHNAFSKIDISGRKGPATRGGLDASSHQPDAVILPGHGTGNDLRIEIINIAATGADSSSMLLDFDIALYQRVSAARAEFGPFGFRRVLEFLV
jgi:hypothetical protein